MLDNNALQRSRVKHRTYGSPQIGMRQFYLLRSYLKVVSRDPLNFNVITLEVSNLIGSLKRILAGGIIGFILYVLLHSLGLLARWMVFPCVAIGYVCAILLFPATTGSDNGS